MTSSVDLYIYDLSKGMARQLSMPLLGKQIDGIWHTSIVIFGKEYFYGGDGVSKCPPCGTILGPPDSTVSLGETSLTKKLFHEYLTGLSRETFRPEKYHLFNFNCNTFSNEIAQFLTGRRIPSYITDLPQDVMSTPFGSMIGQYFENVSIQPTSADGGGQNFLDYDDHDTNSDNFEKYLNQSVQDDSSNSSTGSSRIGSEITLPIKVYDSKNELLASIKILKEKFKVFRSQLTKLDDILNEIEFTYDEHAFRKDITNALVCISKDAASDDNSDKNSCFFHVLRLTSLTLPNIFKYSESDEIIRFVIGKKCHTILRIQFLTNLLSVEEVRRRIISQEALLHDIVSLIVSSVLDGSDQHIKYPACCLAYPIALNEISEELMFEVSSALLHYLEQLDSSSEPRKYCIETIKLFTKTSGQVAELASMLAPDVYEKEIKPQ